MPRLEAALADTPVVLINGPRQTGKTTLVESLVRGRSDARYFTFDDAAVLAAAAADPPGFLAGGSGLTVIDEVQKVPALFPAIKLAVDRDRRPGRFLLTGSAHILMLPQISESLAGRMEILTLWPFSQGEIAGAVDGFVDAAFADRRPRPGDAPALPDLRGRLLRGGYPEAIERTAADRRRAWFASYVTTILQRDVRDLANIEGLTEMPRLLRLLAARAGGLMNKAEISRDADIAYATLDRYLTLLEMTFLLQPLPAWSGNLGKRLTKAPKVHLCDSALVAHLLGVTAGRLSRNPELIGPLLEVFVAMELRKQATWAETPVSLHHYRTAAGREVDLVLEDSAGRIVAIEVKASASFGKRETAGLRSLAEDAGERFHRGILLYGGDTAVPLAANLDALPVGALWHWSGDR